MKIFEVKNNLVKILYEAADNLILSGFVIIKDENQPYIGQIMHLESNEKGNIAIVKLIFNFNADGVVSNYNGSIPSTNSEISVVNSEELLGLLPAQDPILIGELAQQGVVLNIDKSVFDNKLLICCENLENENIIKNNFKKQLQKTVILNIDGDCDFDEKVVIAAKDFKLPLNYDTINFIYEKGLDDANAETKATIQEIFLEVQEYAKTTPDKFIPFNTFKDVVDAQYQELQLVELVLLKNKLLKFYDEGIFAQEKEEFENLKNILQQNTSVVVDLSHLDDVIQREMIDYIYKVMQEIDEEFYTFLKINNSNSDKKLLKQVYTTKNVHSVTICGYTYKYLNELKQIAKDMILFAPLQQQHDFASYNTFLNKLNNDEFVIYGKATHSLPLIVRAEVQNITAQQEPLSSVEEQIIKDVDEIYTAPVIEPEPELELEPEPESELQIEIIEDELTEDDLDFIDEVIETPQAIYENIPVVDDVDSFEPLIMQNEEFSAEVFSDDEEMSDDIMIDEEAQQPEPIAETIEILPAAMPSTPIVPVYSAEIPEEDKVMNEPIEQGDIVMHTKYGKGTVEKLINYGNKTLCSIHFDNVGRRLLDPTLSELTKL